MDFEDSIQTKAIQDDDVALARLLQEQERALYLFGRSSSIQHTADEELTDEELARRLQEEEDLAAYGGVDDPALQPGSGSGSGAVSPRAPQEQSSLPFSYEDMLTLGDLAGKVSKGLNDDALRSLPVVTVGSLREDPSGTVSLDRCCICQLDFEDGDGVTPLPCRHCYHSECVRQWLQQSRACPVCGAELEMGAAA